MKRVLLLSDVFDTAILYLISWVRFASFCYQSTQTDEIFHIILLFFFISQSGLFYLFFVCVECYCFIWSYSVTHTHTQTHTLGRTPLDERSAGRRDFCLTTRNIHKTETSICPRRNLHWQSKKTCGQRDWPVSFIYHTVYWDWFIEILITLVFHVHFHSIPSSNFN